MIVAPSRVNLLDELGIADQKGLRANTGKFACMRETNGSVLGQKTSVEVDAPQASIGNTCRIFRSLS